MTSRPERRLGPVPSADAALAVLLFLASFGIVFAAADWRREQYIWNARDVWFDADSARVVRIEAEEPEGYNRTAMHPLYPFVSAPPIALMKKAGASTNLAVRVTHSGMGALWISLFYLLLRRFGCRRPDALIFTAVAGSSATAIFWLPVFDTFVMGGVSLFPALALAAGPRPGTTLQHVGAWVVGLGITVTNGMAAFFTTLSRLPRRQFFIVTAASVAIVVAIAIAHKFAFRGSTVFLEDPGGEAAWILAPTSGGPVAVLRAFFFGSMVAPEIRFEPNWLEAAFPLMTFQFGGLFSGTAWSWPATLCWAALLALGAWALLKRPDNAGLRAVLVPVILYQLLLHILYGRETFLYAPHFMPLLVGMAALATRTPLRKLVLSLAVVLIVANVLNNVPQFTWAKAYTNRNLTLNGLRKAGVLKNTALSADPAWAYRFWRDLEWGR